MNLKKIADKFNKDLEDEYHHYLFEKLRKRIFNIEEGLNIEEFNDFAGLKKSIGNDYTGCYLISNHSKLNQKRINKIIYEFNENKELDKNILFENYVGQATKLIKRIKEHIKNKKFISTDDIRIYFFKAEEDIQTAEQKLIKKYYAHKIDGGENLINAKNNKLDNTSYNSEIKRKKVKWLPEEWRMMSYFHFENNSKFNTRKSEIEYFYSSAPMEFKSRHTPHDTHVNYRRMFSKSFLRTHKRPSQIFLNIKKEFSTKNKD